VIKINLEKTGEKFLPEKLKSHAKPLLRMADTILSGEDENSASQRVALITFIIRVVSAFIALVSQILLARWLGTFEYGIYVAVWVAVVILSTITCIGFPSAVVRFIGEYRERGRPDVMDCIARAFNWPKIAFLPTYILRPIAIILFAGGAFILGFPANAETTMWAAIIASLIATFIQFGVLLSKLRKTIPYQKPTYKIKTWVLIALPIFLVEGFYVLMTSVDVLFVSVLMTPENCHLDILAFGFNGGLHGYFWQVFLNAIWIRVYFRHNDTFGSFMWHRYSFKHWASRSTACYPSM